MADINLQEVHDFMIEIARKVGERITAATPTTGAAGSKKNCMLQCTEEQGSKPAPSQTTSLTKDKPWIWSPRRTKL